jgi:hypothetical protein
VPHLLYQEVEVQTLTLQVRLHLEQLQSYIKQQQEQECLLD